MHLYIHIPFCHRICPYCSFYKHTPGGTDLAVFVEALLTEARFVSRQHSRNIHTIYLGGGTPSMLSPTHLRHLLTGLREIFDWSQLCEFTLEANPATFTVRTAELYRELGVTRVSLGVQSFLEKDLRTLGREHTATQAEDSVRLLRAAGDLEVNIDLIFSVPGQSLEDWRETVKKAVSLAPDHLSAYNLTYEEDTTFFEKFTDGTYGDDPDLNAQMFTLAEDLLTAAGFEHYETSNYARPGFRSRHNEGYWAGNDYLGLGPSAVSTVARLRWQNVADTATYLSRIESVGHAQDQIEELDDEAWRLERVALMLRTKEGLPAHFLPTTVNWPRLDGLVEWENDHIILTRAGALLVDSIAAELA